MAALFRVCYKKIIGENAVGGQMLEEGKQCGPHSLPARHPFLLPKEMTSYSRSHPFPTPRSRAGQKTLPSFLPDRLSNDHVARFGPEIRGEKS